MEEANEIGNAETFKRLVAKALPLAFVAGLITVNLSVAAAAGAFFGAFAAAIYASGYLGSHLAAASGGVRGGLPAPTNKDLAQSRLTPPKKTGLFSGALLRLAAAGGGGAAAYLAGRQVLITYLISFGVVFGVLVISEFPRIRRRLQEQGVLVPGQAKDARTNSSKGAAA